LCKPDLCLHYNKAPEKIEGEFWRKSPSAAPGGPHARPGDAVFFFPAMRYADE